MSLYIGNTKVNGIFINGGTKAFGVNAKMVIEAKVALATDSKNPCQNWDSTVQDSEYFAFNSSTNEWECVKAFDGVIYLESTYAEARGSNKTAGWINLNGEPIASAIAYQGLGNYNSRSIKHPFVVGDTISAGKRDSQGYLSMYFAVAEIISDKLPIITVNESGIPSTASEEVNARYKEFIARAIGGGTSI